MPEVKSSAGSPRPHNFGRYEVVDEIGDGAMGRVYRGFDPLVRRVVAIKTVRSEHLTKNTADEYLRRFRREAQSAGGLAHPHIVSIYDVGEDYFVMEFLEGTTLEGLLKAKGKLEVTEALRLLAPVADALDFAHKAGIVHRDIKPANIMVLPDGRPKLMDFGVAHVEASVMTRAGEILGSPSYMAPEQIAGGEGEVTLRADLFSLAVVAYEAVTGQKPFQGTNITTIIYRVVHEAAPPPRKFNGSLPPHYDEVFARALAKNPGDRYPSATAFLDALNLKEFELTIDSVLGGLGAEPSPGKPEGPTARPQPSALDETLSTEALDRAAVESAAAAIATAAAPAAPATARWRTPAIAVAAALVLGLAWLLSRQAAEPPAQEPLAGLRVETEPAGAAIWLDGAELGRSPLTLERVEPGSHTVRVALEGFAPAQLGFEVADGSRTAPLKFALEPVAGTLHLSAQPEGATVRVDGKPSGQAPLAGLLLTPGPHDVRVEREGFAPWSRRVEVRAGQRLDLEARLDPRSVAKAVEPTPVPLREGDLVDLGPEVTPPQRIAGETPGYPKAAAKARLQGLVVVEMVVTEKGEPTDIRVVESAGEILDRAVVSAVQSWRFEPARKAGVKVRVRWQVRQRFQIS